MTTPRSQGFTLIELVAAMAIASVLVVAIGSSMLLATAALPRPGDAMLAAVDAGRALDAMLADLNFALTFTERTDQAVAFTVADRNFDGQPEAIRYAWSGTPGDPVTRATNGQPPVNVIPSAHSFAIGYDVRGIVGPKVVVTPTTVTNATLATFDGWQGVVATNAYEVVDASHWVAQGVFLNLPADTTQVTIKRVQLRLRRGPTGTGSYTIAIHQAMTPSDPRPDPAAIDAVIGNAALLPLAETWQTFNFTGVPMSLPTGRLFVVVSAEDSAELEVNCYRDAAAPADPFLLRTTSDSGATWDPSSATWNRKDARVVVVGDYQYDARQSVSATRWYVRGVRLALQTGSQTVSRATGATRVLASPEVETP